MILSDIFNCPISLLIYDANMPHPFRRVEQQVTRYLGHRQ